MGNVLMGSIVIYLSPKEVQDRLDDSKPFPAIVTRTFEDGSASLYVLDDRFGKAYHVARVKHIAKAGQTGVFYVPTAPAIAAAAAPAPTPVPAPLPTQAPAPEPLVAPPKPAPAPVPQGPAEIAPPAPPL